MKLIIMKILLQRFLLNIAKSFIIKNSIVKTIFARMMPCCNTYLYVDIFARVNLFRPVLDRARAIARFFRKKLCSGIKVAPNQEILVRFTVSFINLHYYCIY